MNNLVDKSVFIIHLLGLMCVIFTVYYITLVSITSTLLTNAHRFNCWYATLLILQVPLPVCRQLNGDIFHLKCLSIDLLSGWTSVCVEGWRAEVRWMWRYVWVCFSHNVCINRRNQALMQVTQRYSETLPYVYSDLLSLTLYDNKPLKELIF